MVDPDPHEGLMDFDSYEELVQEMPDEIEDLSEADLESLKEEYDEEPN